MPGISFLRDTKEGEGVMESSTICRGAWVCLALIMLPLVLPLNLQPLLELSYPTLVEAFRVFAAFISRRIDLGLRLDLS